MPQFRLIHPDENATRDDVLSVVRDFDSAAEILDQGDATIEVEMTDAVAARFIECNPLWAKHDIVYPDRQRGPR